MHRLDSHINDIEPRIKSIFENAPRQEEPSLQQSLSSYGWILLDSWIAWRTLRFLLRETYIDEQVNEKWFQTPSSYTASQLKAVWKFTDETLEYLNTITGKSFKNLIDNTIQGKRNASAHFTKKQLILGSDSQEIKTIFKALSNVFMFYECGNFLNALCEKLVAIGYTDFMIAYSENVTYEMDRFFESMYLFIKNETFELKCNCKDRECIIEFSKGGCKAGSKKMLEETKFYDVVNMEQKKYNFFGNKGFYQNIDLFLRTVEECWDKV